MNKFLRSGIPYLMVRRQQLCGGVSHENDLYKILGVSKSSSLSEIKQAYYTLSLQYHPDKNKGNEEAAVKFRQVSDAYEILGNAFLRQKYDMNIPVHTIRGHKPPSQVTVRELKYQKFFESRVYQPEFADRSKPRFDDGYFDSAQRYRKKPVDDDRPFPDVHHPERRMITAMFFCILFTLATVNPHIRDTFYGV